MENLRSKLPDFGITYYAVCTLWLCYFFLFRFISLYCSRLFFAIIDHYICNLYVRLVFGVSFSLYFYRYLTFDQTKSMTDLWQQFRACFKLFFLFCHFCTYFNSFGQCSYCGISLIRMHIGGRSLGNDHNCTWIVFWV